MAGVSTPRGTVPERLLALREVSPEPLPAKAPEKLAAVMVPAVKFPEASRLTMVEATFAEVAVLEMLLAAATPELNVFQSVLERYPLVVLLA